MAHKPAFEELIKELEDLQKILLVRPIALFHVAEATDMDAVR